MLDLNMVESQTGEVEIPDVQMEKNMKELDDTDSWTDRRKEIRE